MSKENEYITSSAEEIVTEVHQKQPLISAAKIILAASAVVSVIFARDGLYIPAAVFGLLLLISCFLPVRKEVQLIAAAACGFPLLIFAAYPWTGALSLLLLMTGLFYLGGQKLCVKSG
ncbi:MAG TPA: hypothetical protein O0Y17_05800, partial [Methanocorpusculum sp.]|nr:hypothetical protein [Methanocorpusculum sp.]